MRHNPGDIKQMRNDYCKENGFIKYNTFYGRFRRGTLYRPPKMWEVKKMKIVFDLLACPLYHKEVIIEYMEGLDIADEHREYIKKKLPDGHLSKEDILSLAK